MAILYQYFLVFRLFFIDIAETPIKIKKSNSKIRMYLKYDSKAQMGFGTQCNQKQKKKNKNTQNIITILRDEETNKRKEEYSREDMQDKVRGRKHTNKQYYSMPPHFQDQVEQPE